MGRTIASRSGGCGARTFGYGMKYPAELTWIQLCSKVWLSPTWELALRITLTSSGETG